MDYYYYSSIEVHLAQGYDTYLVVTLSVTRL